MGKLLDIIEKFLRWLEPHKYAFDDDNPEPLDRKKARQDKKDKKKKNKKLENSVVEKVSVEQTKPKRVKKSSVAVIDKTPTHSEAVSRNELGVDVVALQSVMTPDDAFERMRLSNSHVAYYIHTSTHHQIAVKFEPKSAWRYYERDDVKRKQLKPLLFPKANKPFDRTHVIPVGFHGSENDSRLLVGFNSELNRQDLNDFETYIKEVNNETTVLWFVDIEKQVDDSALWKAYVWDMEGRPIAIDTFHDTDPFVWL